jgi:hypothetical protein
MKVIVVVKKVVISFVLLMLILIFIYFLKYIYIYSTVRINNHNQHVTNESPLLFISLFYNNNQKKYPEA